MDQNLPSHRDRCLGEPRDSRVEKERCPHSPTNKSRGKSPRPEWPYPGLVTKESGCSEVGEHVEVASAWTHEKTTVMGRGSDVCQSYTMTGCRSNAGGFGKQYSPSRKSKEEFLNSIKPAYPRYDRYSTSNISSNMSNGNYFRMHSIHIPNQSMRQAWDRMISSKSH